MNYKNRLTGKVITPTQHAQLPREKQLEYTSTYDEVDSDEDDTLLGVGIVLGAEMLIDAISSNDDSSIDTADTFGNFGDGDTGGAGAGGDW